MISHPAVERLLTEHGNTAAGRRAARTALEEYLVAEARRVAQHAARSIRCAQGDHRRMARFGDRDYEVGCLNDGSTCICECHDPQEATP